MKKIFKSKIFVTALACLLLVGVFAGVYTLANDNSIEFTEVNLEYSDYVHITYKIAANIDATEDIVVKFWGVHPTDANDDGIYDETPDLTANAQFNETDGTYVAASKGFAPYEMTQVVYAQAVIVKENGEEVASTNVVRYSVAEYLFAGLGEDATLTQKALWSALVDYIEYAQVYLGWTENSKPSDLAYVKVTGGYILAQDNSGEKYTSGMYAVGGTFTIVPNVSEEEFGAWYRADANSYVTTVYSYSPSATAEENYRHYMAVCKSDITVDGGKAYGALIQGNKGYKAVRYNADADGVYHVGYLHVAAVAPLTRVNGETTEYFSHWTDAEGNIVSYNTAYIFQNPSMVDGVTTPGQSYALTANYTTEASKTAMTYTGNKLNAAYDVFDPETGLINSSSRPADENGDDKEGYGGGQVHFSAASSLTGEIAYRTVISFDLKIEARDVAEGETLIGNNHYSDFFINSKSKCHNQIGFGFVKAGITEGISFINVESVKDGNNYIGYYFLPCQDSGAGNSLPMYRNNSELLKYGETYAIDLEVISTLGEDGKYTATINYYVAGTYYGTSTIPTTYYPTYAASGNIYFDIGTLKRTRSKTTVSNITVVEVAH